MVGNLLLAANATIGLRLMRNIESPSTIMPFTFAFVMEENALANSS